MLEMRAAWQKPSE